MCFHCHPSKLSASICAFFAAFLLTCRSRNRRASFPFGSQQQANEALRHGLPTSRLMDYDISAGLSFLSERFHRLGCQPRRSSPIAFEARPDVDEAFRQPAFAGPSALQTFIPDRFTFGMVISNTKTV